MAAGWDDLLERFQSGAASAEELAELESLLRADAERRRRLVDAILLEVHLHKALATMSPPEVAARRFPRWLAWTMAASVLLAVGAWIVVAFRGNTDPSPRLESGQVVQAGAAATDVVLGKPFEVAGDRAAVLHLTDDSRAELDPATKAVVRGRVGDVRQVVEVTEGGGTFRVAPGADAFRVDTPAGSVTALGTEFTVKLKPSVIKTIKNASKRTLVLAVFVAEGAVRVDAGGRQYVLHAGNRRAFGDDGQQNNHDDGNQNNNDGNQGNR